MCVHNGLSIYLIQLLDSLKPVVHRLCLLQPGLPGAYDTVNIVHYFFGFGWPSCSHKTGGLQ